MTLETKHGVFYFRAFSHLEVLPGCLKRPSVIREGDGDLPGFWQHLVKDLQSPESKEEDGQEDVYSRDAAGGREIDINFLLPFGELSSKPEGLREQGRSPSRMACFCEGWQSEEGWEAIWVIWDPWELISEGSGGARNLQDKWGSGHCPSPIFTQTEIKMMFEQKISLNNLRQPTGNGEEGRLKVLSPSYAAESLMLTHYHPWHDSGDSWGANWLNPLCILQVEGTEVYTHVCLVLKPSSITLLWKGGLEFNISWQECILLCSPKGLFCCSLLRQWVRAC